MNDDIKNIREALIKFDEISMDTDIIIEKINAATIGFQQIFKNYENLSGNSNDILEQQKAVMKTISALQIALNSTAEIQLNMPRTLQKTITDTIENAKIDTEKIETIIKDTSKKFENIFDNGVWCVDREKNALTKATLNLNKVVLSMQTAINKIEAEAAKSTSKFEITSLQTFANFEAKIEKELDKLSERNTKKIRSINRSIPMILTTFLLIIGFVMGAATMTYFKIDAISNFYFSNYDKKQIALESKIEKANILAKNIVLGGYEMNMGKLSDTKKQYIAIKKKSLNEKPFFADNGDLVVVLK